MTNPVLIVKQNQKGIFVKIGGVFQQICNFKARILEEIVFKRLDGTVERHVKIKAALNGLEHIFDVSYAQFIEQTWVGVHLGLDAVVNGKVAKQREFCSIINKSSSNKIMTTEIQKLGFFEHDGKLNFLHNSGSISADGIDSVLVRANVEGTLRFCKIPPVSVDDDPQSLVEKFLALSDIAVNNLGVGSSLLAAVTRAPLTSLKSHKFSLVYVGETGKLKTATALIGQACFGAEFKDPPASFLSTPKSTELTAQEAANILLVIDDYTTALKNPETERLVENIIGGIGNGVVRGFAVSSTKNATSPLIEAVTLMTVECIPEMPISRKERCMFALFMDGDVDLTELTQYQKRAASGDYVKVIGMFIAHILQNHEQIKASIEGVFERYRADAKAELDGDNLHLRAPSNVSDLMLGIHFFLRFCVKGKYISREQANEMRDYHFENLIGLAKQQKIMHETQDIKKMVKTKVSNFIRRGGFKFLEIDERMRDGIKDGKYPDNFVGWEDYGADILYVQSDRSSLITSHLPEELQKVMGCGEKSFWSSMYRYGLLKEIDVAGKKNTVRKTINKKIVRIYSLDRSLLYTNQETGNSKRRK